MLLKLREITKIEPLKSNYSANNMVVDCIKYFDPIHQKYGGNESYSQVLLLMAQLIKIQ